MPRYEVPVRLDADGPYAARESVLALLRTTEGGWDEEQESSAITVMPAVQVEDHVARPLVTPWRDGHLQEVYRAHCSGCQWVGVRDSRTDAQLAAERHVALRHGARS